MSSLSLDLKIGQAFCSEYYYTERLHNFCAIVFQFIELKMFLTHTQSQ